jgi:hypothetical protein
MSTPVLSLLVVVINRAGACPGTGADERAFPASDQRAGARSYGGANADAFCGLPFSSFRVSIAPPLSARNGNRQSEREH